MSRIGKKEITIPAGIEITEANGIVSVKKGNKTIDVDTHNRVGIEIAEGKVCFTRVGDSSEDSAFWGTYRALTANAVEGLDKGFSKSLEINGVGYRAAVKGKVLELQLGYSHPINFEIPEGIEISVDKNIINVKGASKQVVGQTAAIIRGYRKPEPYKGKGVKYTDETIVRKAGKTAS
ncbi:MAG: 50S ribosomal protein L6 [Campylobacteraceae bacterium]|jgi:large subunit ribosomal protein L6|nr:50S ribosomal protein L6 [Campylobacteraceae bacterium]MBT3881686.1 50S ribosomal protein L6 [Campylobacteraceae bacterium]MBT4030980.1 50S ribosomal protein L6 [Campylobacteraceae bacterium]MBT4178658.1 50S ribosomal protein L6 [Campylobacteraceae bacterium]MBT4571748.1 50S ribosomal protein L6 [Campylobacteraceae bacterium]